MFLAGFVGIVNPFEAVTLLTLMLGIALIVGGLLRVFLAMQMKQGTPWGSVVGGLISFLLGVMIVANWPIRAPMCSASSSASTCFSWQQLDLGRPGAQAACVVLKRRLSFRPVDPVRDRCSPSPTRTVR